MMPTQQTPEPYVDSRAAAAFLGQAIQTLHQWRFRGTGPKFYKSGRSVRYRISDLEAWLNARAFTSTAEAEEAVKR